jgi:hypothetical protein
MKKLLVILIIPFLLTACGTIFGGHISECQKSRPGSGEPSRTIRPAAFIGDLLFCPTLGVDFLTGAIYKPCQYNPETHTSNAVATSTSNKSTSQVNKDVITKYEVKLLKKTLPSSLVIRPDYIERRIWIETPEITTSEIYGSTRKHKFYFVITKDKEGNFHHGDLRYKFTYLGPSWLFLNKIYVLTAKTNKETLQGIGNQYEIEVPYLEKRDKVFSDATIKEEFDIVNNESVVKWLKDVAANNVYSRLRYYGNEVYENDGIKASNLQEYAASILKALELYN